MNQTEPTKVRLVRVLCAWPGCPNTVRVPPAQEGQPVRKAFCSEHEPEAREG